MPTKKKRVGFIPREDVMRIIDKLSIENNLSNSKIISILVEEALSIRGMFNKRSGQITKSHKENNNISQYSSENSGLFTDNSKFKIDTKSRNQSYPTNSTNSDEDIQDNFDFQTYKKFLTFLKFQEMMDRYNT